MAAFKASPLVGFKTTEKVSSMAVISAGERLFVGNEKGGLAVYECRSDSIAAVKAGSFECHLVDTICKGGGTNDSSSSGGASGAVRQLLGVEEWRALLALVGGQLKCYDLHTYRPLFTVGESRGVTCFCVHPAERVLYVAVKRRLQVYTWQAVSVLLKREFFLPDVPRAMCVSPLSQGTQGQGIGQGQDGNLIVAFPNEYSIMDTCTGNVTSLLRVGEGGGKDTKKSGGKPFSITGSLVGGSTATGEGDDGAGSTPVLLPMAASAVRGPRVLLSTGCRGVLADVSGREQQERLLWASPPLAVTVSGPYLLALLPNQVDVHNLSTLAPVQSLELPGSTTMASCQAGGSRGQVTFLCASRLTLLKMVPLEFQVETFVEKGKYEDALSLCFVARELLGGVDVQSIHERYAFELFSWGDYEAAVEHFLLADVPIAHVVSLFPSLIPPNCTVRGHGGGGAEDSSRPLIGANLSRAARALARYLEKRRASVVEAANRQENSSAADKRGWVVEEDEDEEADDSLQTAQLLDTMLLSCRLLCSPPRRDALVELLSGEDCRCLVECCAPQLAAGGRPFVEALLWLYRGRGDHKEALGLLTEERCCGSAAERADGPARGGGWSKAQFYQWTADYLRDLWASNDASAHQLVLGAVRPVLEADPALGLSVFRPKPKASSSSSREPPSAPKGVSVEEVIGLLKGVSCSNWQEDVGREGGDLPLSSGRALAIAFLESLVAREEPSTPTGVGEGEEQEQEQGAGGGGGGGGGGARGGGGGGGGGGAESSSKSSQVHDELAYLLMEGLLVELEAEAVQHSEEDKKDKKDTNRRRDNNVSPLSLVYRDRLQAFLRTSEQYNPARLLAVLPNTFLQEHALLLSRLGRHGEVLRIYVRQLKDEALAEAHCDRIWRQAMDRKERQGSSSINSSSSSSSSSGGKGAMGGEAHIFPDEDVYLCLLDVYLSDVVDVSDLSGESDKGGAEGGDGLASALSLLERYHDRVDATMALSLLPAALPLARVEPFLRRALRHWDATQRHSMLVHQLSRADFVNAKYELIRLESRASMLPELALSSAGLGRLLRSCPRVELTEPLSGAEYSVGCIKHIFAAHVVLQFVVTNILPDQRLVNVRVRVEGNDADLYLVKAERPLPAVPPGGTGSCYSVLERALGPSGVVPASFQCELRFETTQALGLTSPQQQRRQQREAGWGRDVPLEDLELSSQDLVGE